MSKPTPLGQQLETKRAIFGTLGMIVFVIACAIGIPWWSSTSEWRTRMEFFGRVIDDQTNLVTNANVSFSWTDLSLTGNSTWSCKSNEKGLFTLPKTRGRTLIVSVSKDGYYTYTPLLAFNYAGDEVNFVANRTNPVVFRLKRMGAAEPLAYCAKEFVISRDGSPIIVNLGSCAKGGNPLTGFKVECWTHDRDVNRVEHYDWRCRISVPNGGIQEYEEQFPFSAPTNGYLPSQEIKMETSTPHWQDSVERGYFLKFSNGTYGRMKFTMIAFNDHFFKFEALVNPSGSRNLEFDPNKLAQVSN